VPEIGLIGSIVGIKETDGDVDGTNEMEGREDAEGLMDGTDEDVGLDEMDGAADRLVSHKLVILL